LGQEGEDIVNLFVVVGAVGGFDDSREGWDHQKCDF
jgi:hypothetical protein